MSNIRDQLLESLNSLRREKSSLYESSFGCYMHALNEFKEYSHIPEKYKDMTYEDIRIEFYRHFNKWEDETILYSDMWKAIQHPEFREMVNMGWAGIPFAIEIIKRKPNVVVYVIAEASGIESPAKGKRINLNEMCKLWLKALGQDGN